MSIELTNRIKVLEASFDLLGTHFSNLLVELQRLGDKVNVLQQAAAKIIEQPTGKKK